MKKYRIIKDFDMFEKGFIFTENNFGDYVMSIDEKTSYGSYKFRTVVSRGAIEDWLFKGLAEEVSTEDNKIKETLKFLDDMQATYERMKLNVSEEYAEGDVAFNEFKQSTAVYENLIKFINATRNKLS